MTQTPPPMNYAGFSMRMIASAVDTVLSGLLLLPVLPLLDKIFGFTRPQPLENPQDLSQEEVARQSMEILMQSMPSFFLQTVMLSVIVVIFWASKSATPGKMLFKMRIVDAKTGNPMTRRQSILRYVGYILSTLPMCLGFFWIYFDKRCQGFHDKFAGTVVVYTFEKIDVWGNIKEYFKKK